MSQGGQPSPLDVERVEPDTRPMRTRLLRFPALILVVVPLAILCLSGCGNAGARARRALVVLDAGHGGRDPGAVVDDVHEADINLAVMRRVTRLIQEDDRMDVRRTRTLDITVSLEDRIELANESGATLYLSIQSNASSYRDAAGVETLVSDRIDPDAPAWRFAEILQDAVANVTGARDRGVRSQDLYLHRAAMPAALVEVGFLSNEAERARLLDPAYQQILAQGIYEGIVAYLNYADPSFAAR